ncbi:MAG: non-hydrolyzing UDP-N-acetylglucosamine 2-epimerase [Deltaproteobacteria bacterium]
MHIVVMIGTRPEAIKMAPVVRALKEDPKHQVTLCASGQHREMLNQALADFDLVPDINLDVMVHDQGLSELTAKIIAGVGGVLSSLKPDWLLVQGDTTTVMAASLSAYYQNIRVGHVEAGLRSFNKRAPFPEEMNRRVTSVLADFHFAPTLQAQENLLNEGIDAKSVVVTGNTVIDALLWMREKVQKDSSLLPEPVQRAKAQDKKIILVTCHRREVLGEPLEQIFLGLRSVAQRNPNCLIVYPVHLNPRVQMVAKKLLSSEPHILLTEPLAYKPFVALLNASDFVVSDSGGIQEEAPALQKPVLVLREVTERPEGVQAGVAKLVGSDARRIQEECEILLQDPKAYQRMSQGGSPYGDGQASARIRKVLFG